MRRYMSVPGGPNKHSDYYLDREAAERDNPANQAHEREIINQIRRLPELDQEALRLAAMRGRRDGSYPTRVRLAERAGLTPAQVKRRGEFLLRKFRAQFSD